MRQALLFPENQAAPIGKDTADNRLTLLALNIRAPSLKRANVVIEYLVGCGANVLVLTEARSSLASDKIIVNLESIGYKCFAPVAPEREYLTIVATKGLLAKDFQASVSAFSNRVTVIDVETFAGRIRVVGVYAPTNSLTDESSNRRQAFQRLFRSFLKEMMSSANGNSVIVGGDLNVLEPEHRPRWPSFQPHDYEFYTSFRSLGLRDAFKFLNPDRVEHSWLDRRGLGQRLDHFFISDYLIRWLRACRYDHITRTSGLSDHSAMILTLGPEQNSDTPS